MAGPPNPPLETRPSTFISNSSDSGSIRGRDGKAFEETTASPRPPRGSTESTASSEISAHFQDECKAHPRPLFTESTPEGWLRRNFVLGPATLTTGCRPMVLVTTPPQPASKARRMLLSDSVGG